MTLTQIEFMKGKVVYMALSLNLSSGTGISSVGTKISVSDDGSTWTEIPDLQSVPELGGDPEKIDTTTLADTVKTSIPGVQDLGDLAFTFLYDKANFLALKSGLDSKKSYKWQVEFNDGLVMSFDAIPNIKLSGADVNSALTYTINMGLQSEIVPNDSTP